MYLISSLIFAFSVNLDAFLVGMSYGIRKIHITIPQNLMISLISFAGTFLSLFLGQQFVIFLPSFLTEYLGTAILSFLGLFYIGKFFFRKKSSLHRESLTTTLPLREILLLGSALSLNNIGIGIGASISGILLVPTAAITLLTAFLFLFAGNHLGNVPLLRFSNHYADLISGSMLIVLALYNYIVT